MIETTQNECKSKDLLYSSSFTGVAIQNCTLHTLDAEIAIREEDNGGVDRKFHREGETWLDLQE